MTSPGNPDVRPVIIGGSNPVRGDIACALGQYSFDLLVVNNSVPGPE